METPEVDGVVQRVLDGDTNAYAQIVRHYQDDVWRVVASILDDWHQTESLVQQAFVDAFRHLDAYERGREFRVWIKAIARNLVRQELRRRAREHEHLIVYREELGRRLIEDSRACRFEELQAEALEHCKEQLPVRAMELLDMRYARFMSFEDMARTLRRTVSGVRQGVCRIRVLLRECVESRMAHT